jgi:hypothetical protein
LVKEAQNWEMEELMRKILKDDSSKTVERPGEDSSFT